MIGVDHATRLAEQLLSLARLGPDFSQGDFVALALRGRVGEMFIELESRAANRDVTLINEVPAGLQLHANADAFDIALRNLLDNAIKHGASPGEVRVSARQCSPDFVELTIDDDGPGIPQDAHAQISGGSGDAASRNRYQPQQGRSQQPDGEGLARVPAH